MDNDIFEKVVAIDQWLEEIYTLDKDGELTPQQIAAYLQTLCQEFGISEEESKRAIFKAIEDPTH